MAELLPAQVCGVSLVQAPIVGMGGPCNAKSGIANAAMPEVALLASRARPWLPEGISSPPEGN